MNPTPTPEQPAAELPPPYKVFVIGGKAEDNFRLNGLTDHESGLPMMVPTSREDSWGDTEPFQALIFPAKAGTQYRRSRLIDSDSQLSIMLPETPELAGWAAKGAADARRFFNAFR